MTCPIGRILRKAKGCIVGLVKAVLESDGVKKIQPPRNDGLFIVELIITAPKGRGKKDRQKKLEKGKRKS